jgi:hypothetical protein
MPEIKAMIVMDGEGARVAAKYYSRGSFPDRASETELEKKLFRKARGAGAGAAAKTDTEVALVDGCTAVYKWSGGDLLFFVVGGGDENELVLVAVLDALCEALALLLRGGVDKRNVLQNLELLLLAMDETVDGGIILELDPREIDARVMLKGAVPESISSYKELTVGAVVDKLKDRAQKQFARP